MKNRNRGFGGLQFVLVFAIIGVAATFAVPEYKSYMTKAKLTEAFNLAGESKRKLSEFYMLNGRLPGTQNEAELMITSTVAPPEYVRDMVVKPADSKGRFTIRVYLKEGVIENPVAGEDQFIYVEAQAAGNGSYALTWSCGGGGLEPDLLPEDCEG
ncbi:pilin [Elongatibacter sediminis]|uniref:Pilin n=1 Tax=Elongatibacter sediminis TaxID=3119006 RepID=A0AAW9RK30_9GAMM